MSLKQLIQAWQHAMNKMGANLTEDGDAGAKTLAAAEAFELVSVELKRKPKGEAPAPVAGVSSAPWLDEAKKHSGKGERDSRFVAFMAGFWRIVGLPGYKTIKGSSYAWCGLFVAAMLSTAGYKYQKNGAGARNWAKYGQEIDFRKNGIPRGAIIHINHAGNCSSGSGNHVGFSNGDCTAEDVKSGAINIYGGNQSDHAKISAFSVRELCEVRWPIESSLPGKVLKSSGCKGSASGESTR